jgi:hypothetical protein
MSDGMWFNKRRRRIEATENVSWDLANQGDILLLGMTRRQETTVSLYRSSCNLF